MKNQKHHKTHPIPTKKFSKTKNKVTKKSKPTLYLKKMEPKFQNPFKKMMWRVSKNQTSRKRTKIRKIWRLIKVWNGFKLMNLKLILHLSLKI